MDNYDLVGKGSHQERIKVQSYLKTLGFEKLRRSQSLEAEPFDDEEATSKYNLERNNSSAVSMLNMQTSLSIIETLVDITPKPKSVYDVSPIAINDPSISYKTPYFKHSYSEVPPIPDFGHDPTKFEQYIYLITHSTFHHKGSSKFNGIISKILMNLFNPLNQNTLTLRNTNSFNHALHYYSKKWNIATCRELLVQMKFEDHRPTTTTYNIMLGNLLTLKHIKHTANPYHIALKHLKQMKENRVSADVITWNWIFKLLNDDASRSTLLFNRKQLNIPLDPRSLHTILRFLLEDKGISAHSAIELLSNYGISIDSKILELLVKRLILEEQTEAALKLIQYTRLNFNIKVTPNLLNLFLVDFSAKGRVDLVVAIINTFKSEYNIRPDFQAYNLVMKAIANTGHWKQKVSVLRILYQKMMKDTKGNVAGEYWIRRLRSRLKFIYDEEVNLTSKLTPQEAELKNTIEEIKLGSKVPYIIKDESKEYLKFARLLGVFSRSVKSKKTPNDELQRKKDKAIKYRKNIDAISIQKAMVKRIPYAKDPYNALKSELEERRLI